jgi:hypothetical protein
MGFLKRLFGGGNGETSAHAPVDPAEAEAAERQHELEVLREEQGRMDELTRRQLRYSDYSWTPPAQGGERRADDTDPSAGETSQETS